VALGAIAVQAVLSDARVKTPVDDILPSFRLNEKKTTFEYDFLQSDLFVEK